VDVTGLVLVGSGSSGVVWALVRGNAAGWTAAEVLTTGLGGAALLVAFVGWELRTPAPMLPMRLFRTGAFAAGNAVAFLHTAALFGMVYLLSQYLQAGLGHSPLGAGLRTLPWTVVIFFAAPLSGALVDRIGPRPLIVSGLSLQAAGFAWIALSARDGWDYSVLAVGMAVAGWGVSMAMPAGQHAVMNAVRPEQLGAASGSYSLLRQFGGVFGVAILAATFGASGGYGSRAEFTAGAVPAFAVAAGLSLAGALAGTAIGRHRRPAAVPQAAPEVVGAVG
jgi:MFS family permease